MTIILLKNILPIYLLNILLEYYIKMIEKLYPNIKNIAADI